MEEERSPWLQPLEMLLGTANALHDALRMHARLESAAAARRAAAPRLIVGLPTCVHRSAGTRRSRRCRSAATILAAWRGQSTRAARQRHIHA